MKENLSERHGTLFNWGHTMIMESATLLEEVLRVSRKLDADRHPAQGRNPLAVELEAAATRFMDETSKASDEAKKRVSDEAEPRGGEA